MRQTFQGLAAAQMILLAATAALGWSVKGEQMFVFHFALGLFTSIYTVFVHVVVYIYFIVCAKIVGEAAERAGLDPELEARARKNKLLTFRVALIGIVTIIATAILGARIFAVSVDPAGDPDPARRAVAVGVHVALVFLTLIAQPFVAVFEYHAIRGQSKLTDEALAALDASRRNSKTHCSEHATRDT